MDLVQLHLTLLNLVFLFLGSSCGKSSHSLDIFYTLVPELDPILPQFVAKAYVDDQLIGFFDSNTERARSAVYWMEKVKNDDPGFWEWVTHRAVDSERRFRDDLKVLQKQDNQKFHTWQRRHGCEVGDDGYSGSYLEYAYNGRKIISLDPATFTSTVADAKAQVLKRRWEMNPVVMMRRKKFLEEECPVWLLEFVAYGNETLIRKEAPLVKVTRKTLDEKQEILICEVHGFYPREMEATWRRDGEIWEHRTSRRNIAPNSDGTYYAWLSVDIEPMERSHFRCHVDHSSLTEPLILAWEEPASHHLRALWIVSGVFLLAALWVLKYFLRQAATSRSQASSKRREDSPMILKSQRLTSHAAQNSCRAEYHQLTVRSYQESMDIRNSSPNCEQETFLRRTKSW